MREVRCPSPTCKKRIGSPSDDLRGDIALFCRRCKTRFGSETADLPRLACPRCGRWIASGVVAAGSMRLVCQSCSMVVAFDIGGARLVETPDKPGPKVRRRRVAPLTDADLVAHLEDRWRLLRLSAAHRSVDLAVGLRFDVFSRDGFRCRYCGRGPDVGVTLEADHVVPRSVGGPDILDNLVTACWDCNRGKSAKPLDTEVHSSH